VTLFELSDYVDVLAVVSEADLDLIMVGGHAVSFYAERFSASFLCAQTPSVHYSKHVIGSPISGSARTA
jgi:hypothetical protein